MPLPHLAIVIALLLTPLRVAAQPANDLPEGTRLMVERLRELADPEKRNDPYSNRARIAEMRTRTPPADFEERAHFELRLAYEVLFAGDNAEAIRLLDELDGKPEGEFLGATLDATRALAYLRLGEEENCLLRHTTDSCLLPIRDSGIHIAERGSRRAMEIYLELLRDYPDDLLSRWLLNIAAMTLGEHPGGVPRRQLIPPEVFDSEYLLPRFPEVAPGLGLAVRELSGGVVMDDFDLDGDLDLVVSSWDRDDQVRYFRNEGDGTFSERTDEALLTGLVGGLNLVQADYDNDGDPDVLVLRGAWLGDDGNHPNSLLRNNGLDESGRLTFEDVTEASGLLSFHPTQTASWADFDGDGWLDVVIGNESRPRSLHPAELYRNLGPGEDGQIRFEDVAAAVGADIQGFVKAVVWGDVDNDGRPDLYFSILGAENVLLRNDVADEDGRTRFRVITIQAGVGEPVNSFPAWFWDYDNDGWLDLLVSGYGVKTGDSSVYRLEDFRDLASSVAADYLLQPSRGEWPRLYRNRGAEGAPGAFEDVTEKAQLDRTLFAMGCNFGDLDNDGWPDFYLATGETSYESLMPNRMFRNASGEYFQDVTTAGGFGHIQKGHAVAFGDLDNDGDQDVYAVMGGAFEGDIYYNALFENPYAGRPGFANRFLKLRLRGTESNRTGLGARLRVRVSTAEGQRDIHSLISSGGSFGASPLRAEIGLGPATAIEEVEIRWPGSGTVQKVRGLELDAFYEIREGESEARRLEIQPFRLAGGNGGHQAH